MIVLGRDLKGDTEEPDSVDASGHYGAALLAYAPLGSVLGGEEPTVALAGGAGALLFATLPDVDQRISRVPHRGPTHSLAFLAAVAAVLGWVGWHVGGIAGVGPAAPVERIELAVVPAGVAVLAIGSHLVADVLTPAGVDLLWPLPAPAVSLSLVSADDVFANAALLAAGSFVSAVTWFPGGPA